MESAPAARSKQGLEARRQMRVITDLVTIKAAASETGGAYALYETETPVSGGVPPHRQRYDDEGFYVLEGRYRFLVEGDEFEFGPGAFVHVPRGTTHAVVNVGVDPGRMLIIVTPGVVHDEFMDDIGDPADRPPWEPDMARVLAVAPKYGIDFRTSDPFSNDS